MTTSLPPRWRDLVTLPVDARLAAGPEGHDGSALRIGRAVELAVELTNRSFHRLRLVPAGVLRLSFRPHTLLDHHAVTVGDASAADGWGVTAEPVAGNGLRQVLVLRCDRAVELAPGETLPIHLDGLAADGFGGSRATHAELEYSGIVVADDEDAPLADRIVLPLSVLHDVAPAAQGHGSHGSNAATDAISARLGTTDSVLADGVTRSMLWVLLQNRTGADIELRTDGDAAPRISLHTEAAGTLGSSLLGSGRMAISTEPDHLPAGWEVVAPDDRALEPAVPGWWVAGADLAFWVEIVSDAPPGLVPLHVRYENLPGVDPGELTLLLRLGFTQTTIWSTDVVRTMRMWGTGSALELYTGELNVSGALAGRLSASHDEADLGRLTLSAPQGLTIDSPRVRLGEHLEIEVENAAEMAGGGPALRVSNGHLVVGNVAIGEDRIRIGQWYLAVDPHSGRLAIGRGPHRVLTLDLAQGEIPELIFGDGADFADGKGTNHWRMFATESTFLLQHLTSQGERTLPIYLEPDVRVVTTRS